MAQTRREFLRWAAGVGGLLLAGSAPPARPGIAFARSAALRFFATRQSPEGAWRSERYAAFRAGDALTPVVLWAGQSLPPALASNEIFRRGRHWLERLTETQSQRPEPWAELSYPLFTASYAAQVFVGWGDARRAGFWADVLERLRTSQELGWPANDLACGAWSDASAPPRYTAPVPDMLAPNLSATALAVQALAAVGRRASAQTALTFIERCQNFAAVQPGVFDDGGFFFALDDPIRNKAGEAGRDATGRPRFHSYGSATCDGLLALSACGMPREHPRRRAAAAWVRQRSTGLTPAGAWVPGRAAARESLVFYQAQALAAVLLDLENFEPASDESTKQSLALVKELCAAQAADGSWQGVSPASCEDEPLLASSFAVRALALSGEAA